MPEPDYVHLMECVDPHCWYCRDEPRPQSEVDRRINVAFDRVLAWDVGALPVGHPFAA